MTQIFHTTAQDVQELYTFEIQVNVAHQAVAILLIPARDYVEAVELAHKAIRVLPSDRLIPTIRLPETN